MSRFGQRIRSTNLSTSNQVSTWFGNQFVGTGISATGGNEIVNVGVYKYHLFTTTGTFTVTDAKTGAVDIMCVGGGGPGGKGGGAGGGGGAAELKLFTASTITNTSYAVTIGAGGVALATNGTGSSVGSLLTAAGGGYGGGWNGGGYASGSGGSSGGAGNDASTSKGSAIGSNTFVGGNAYASNPYTGGGGGGATAVGSVGTAAGGGGGGLGYLLTSIDSNLISANFSSLSGMTYIASGGSGGSQAVNYTAPSVGGGGTGGNNNGPIAGGNATSFGSGGGGGTGQNTNWGYGKDGLVIIRYLS